MSTSNKVVITQYHNSLQSFYHERLENLIAKYHRYLPDPFANSITPEQQAEAAYYGAVSSMAERPETTTPIGKLVL